MAYELADSVEQVRNYLVPTEDNLFGTDTETTSLNTRIAMPVGLSLSVAEGSALYIPIGHKIGTNLPLEPVMGVIEEYYERTGATPVFFNSKYDLNVLQARFGWFPKRHLDGLELVYLSDPDRKRKGLKLMASELFNMNMEKFEDIFTPEEQKAGILDLSTKSPIRCASYAGADADAALRIARHYVEIRKEQAFAIKIDTKLVDVVRRIEHNGGFVLNRQYIDEKIAELETRAAAMKEQIFRICGTTFEIASPKQLGTVLFERMGIPSPGLTRGRNPQHRTDEETLEKLAHAYPVIDLIITYRKLTKASGSYFAKLKRLDELQIKPRFSFNMYAAPTFRFAAPGGDPMVDGFCGINIQAVSNGEIKDMMAVDLAETSLKDNYLEGAEDELLIAPKKEIPTLVKEWQGDLVNLPWVVRGEEEKAYCLREICEGCPASCGAKGIDLTRRRQKNLRLIPSVREAFMAPEGYTIVSFDYDRQELVIGANMSKEPKWLRALAAGEDLHVITAAAAFGMPLEQFLSLPKDEQKAKRQIGKVLNFATFYGATAYTIARKADISQAAADQIFNGFVRGLPVLFSWINRVHAFSRKSGYTTTFFGRKRWLKQFYALNDRKWAAFADRSAVNTAIQGTAAEVTRMAMVRCQSKLDLAGYRPKEVKFGLQLHDDLTFIVKNELVKQVVPLLKDGMEFTVKSWDVQLTATPKIGTVWGQQKEIKDYNEWLNAA